LGSKYGLKEVWLPVGAKEGEPRCNIFMSDDALTNTQKLLLLVQGSGAVRPGQWARALCINDTLDMGTIFPYLERAKNAGYGVIVFNPNENSVVIDTDNKDHLMKKAFLTAKKPPGMLNIGSGSKPPRRAPIPGNDSPPGHTIYVWDQFVTKAKAEKIAIVAHSAGGHCTMCLLRERTDEVLPRLKVIAFTDSVHSLALREKKVVKKFLKENAINWVKSDRPLDSKITDYDRSGGCKEVSAGHPKHEWTSGCSVESVFKFLAFKVDGQSNNKGEILNLKSDSGSSEKEEMMEGDNIRIHSGSGDTEEKKDPISKDSNDRMET